MGCVSSNLLNREDDFSQLGSSALGHHIVSLTSTTYGLLNLDPPQHQQHSPSSTTTTTAPLTPPQRFTFGSIFPSPLTEGKPLWPESRTLWSEPRPLRSEPEVINSWELMSGLDAESFRFSPRTKTPNKTGVTCSLNKENADPNRSNPKKCLNQVLKQKMMKDKCKWVENLENICPPNGENRVVIYTTSLRGIRTTFEACNAVRATIERFGVVICERDVSMDRGFKDELRDLMEGKEKEDRIPPRVFVKGKYIGGAEEVLRIVEEGLFGELVCGVAKKRGCGVCDGCGGVGFLPCFGCNGSCKVVEGSRNCRVVVRCPDCNENGLVLCPLCT